VSGPGDRYGYVQTDHAAAVGELLDTLPDLVFVLGPDGNVQQANARCTEVLGWSTGELVGRSAFELVHPDDVNMALASLSSVTTKEIGALIELRVRRHDDRWCHLEMRGRPMSDAPGASIVLSARVVDDRHILDLHAGDISVLRAVMNSMPAMVALVDPEGRITGINAAVTRHLGHDPELIRGRTWLSFTHPDDQPILVDAMAALAPGQTTNLDARLRRADGGYDVIDFTVTNHLDDPAINRYIVSGQLASSLIAVRDRIEFLATHDTRTGLLNRDGFHRAATELLGRGGGGLGVILLDIEHFRAINELYGEPAGDAVLQAIGERLTGVRWPDLICARLGGDEFVVACSTHSVDALAVICARIESATTQAVVYGDARINVTVRTAHVFEVDTPSIEALVTRASGELIKRKRPHAPGKDNTLAAIGERRAQVEQLQRGLTNGEIRPWFQPIVTADGTIEAVEALVRWEHPVRGVLAAGQIIPLVHLAGLNDQFDDLILDGGVAFARRLADLGYAHVDVHINVEPKQLANPNFARQVLRRCEAHHVSPAQIVVELTETDLLSPDRSALDNMAMLRQLGARVAIDDFGTGYSSLSHLLELPVDSVKIDRRFVAGLDVDPTSTSLTTAIVGLCHSLSLTCVAEGVEQPYQRQRLTEIGCHSFQGWLYAAAMRPDRLLAALPRIELDTDGLVDQEIPV
jgi:diguanylate cyclase (GGDEF)-like protein/PAS domain S-box-containing protein